MGDSRGRDNEKVPVDDLPDLPGMGYMPFYSENAGLSPNGDGVMDDLNLGLGLKRNAKAIHYTVTDLSTGKVLLDQTTEFVSKTYYSDSYNTVVYGGAFAEDALSLDWLYPIVELDWDEDAA